MKPILSVKFAQALLLCSLLPLLSCGYLLQPSVKSGMINLAKGSYNLDPQHTSVLFKINHMGLSTFVGRFDQVNASLEFDPKDIANAKLSAVINIASIDVNNKGLEESLRGSSWFDADKYPQAFFTTSSVKVIDAKRAQFSGPLTLHGVTRPIVIEVVFNGGANNLLTGHYTLGFSATARFKRSAFAMDYLIPLVADEVDIEVFAEFQQ